MRKYHHNQVQEKKWITNTSAPLKIIWCPAIVFEHNIQILGITYKEIIISGIKINDLWPCWQSFRDVSSKIQGMKKTGRLFVSVHSDAHRGRVWQGRGPTICHLYSHLYRLKSNLKLCVILGSLFKDWIWRTMVMSTTNCPCLQT